MMAQQQACTAGYLAKKKQGRWPCNLLFLKMPGTCLEKQEGAP